MPERNITKLRKNIEWTPDDDARLRKMLLDNEAVPNIASDLQKTGASVRNRARVLGMSAADNLIFRANSNKWLLSIK